MADSGEAGNRYHNNSVEPHWRKMKQTCLGDKSRKGGLSSVKFNAKLIEYIETESVEWWSKLKMVGLEVSFPNKGRATKKTYDQ